MTDQIEVGDQSTEDFPEDVLGIPEPIDTDDNGTIDAWLFQVDADKFVVLSDTDSDQEADTLKVDIDGDGRPELLITETPDGYRLQVDEDGDGTFESDGVLSRVEFAGTFPEFVELLDTTFGDPSASDPAPTDEQSDADPPIVPEDSTEPVDPSDPTGPFLPDAPYDSGEPPTEGGVVEDGVLVGDPEGAAEHWFWQAANGFCVPASIAQIVSEYTGEHYADEQHFVDRANELHLFVVGPDGVPGLTIEGGEALLEDAGVPAETMTDLSVPSLIEFVEDGRGVMLYVDSGELWTGEAVEDDTLDHAVVLTGFDLDRGVAILADPGQPDGSEFEVKISDLEDAWADSGHTALVCDTPAGEMPTTDFEPAGAAAEPTVDPATVDAPEAAPAASENDGQLAGVVSWAVDHPWVVLPVLLGAHLLRPRR